MAELWYRLKEIPDLTLNKYGSLEGRGVDGVIEKHIAFLKEPVGRFLTGLKMSQRVKQKEKR